MVNATSHDTKVVNLVNRKPCCGEARIGKTMLHPGDETEVEVTLSNHEANQTFPLNWRGDLYSPNGISPCCGSIGSA